MVTSVSEQWLTAAGGQQRGCQPRWASSRGGGVPPRALPQAGPPPRRAPSSSLAPSCRLVLSRFLQSGTSKMRPAPQVLQNCCIRRVCERPEPCSGASGKAVMQQNVKVRGSGAGRPASRGTAEPARASPVPPNPAPSVRSPPVRKAARNHPWNATLHYEPRNDGAGQLGGETWKRHLKLH